MPRFRLNAGESFADKPEFVRGYVEAMFFTEHGGDDMDEDASTDELSAEAWAEIENDCAVFQFIAAGLLSLAYTGKYEPVQAGRDFWFTRNGHGVGFWDRDELDRLGISHALSDLCGTWTQFSEVNVYTGDDGLIYLY